MATSTKPKPAAAPLLILLAAVLASAQGVIRIASMDDLRKIGNAAGYPLFGDYELVCDIDASDSRERPFAPIGGGGSPFTGSFSGRGGAVYVVRNLYINRPDAGHVGLFGVVGYSAEVSNVGVDADTIIGGYAVGTLAGSSNGRIVNCYGAGVVVAAGRERGGAGGLAGVSAGAVYESYSSAEVRGADNAGGLVGLLRASANGGEVRRCFALGRVSGANNVGGLVGQAFGGRVAESFSAGHLSGAGAVGGLIGLDFASSARWSDRGVFTDDDGDAVYAGAVEVKSSFWDIDASGAGVSAGGSGRGGSRMRSRATFAGWDFDSVWAIEEGAGYPQLARSPYSKRTIVYAVDDEGCGRLRIGGVAELYRYTVSAAPGAAGPAVSAAAWEGCRFTGWSDGRREAPRVDAALRDTAFTAKFERVGGPPARAYRYWAGVGGSLAASGAPGLAASVDTAAAGAVVVAAVPKAGYRFAGWSDGFAGAARADSAPPPTAPAALFDKLDGNIIEISRYVDLRLIGEDGAYPLDGDYELTRDIEVPATGGFGPIGTAAAPFTGSFRGNGHRISGFDIGRGGGGGGFAGLFGYAVGADIRDLAVDGSVSGGDGAGALVGECVNTVIEGCAAAGVVRGRSGVGGLVGRAVSSLIIRCRSAASVEGSGSAAGGLVGESLESFLARSCASGAVAGAMYAGGAVGAAIGGFAQDCCAAGSVTSGGPAGGFICLVGGGAGVLRSYSAGLTTGAAPGSGGFAGTLGGGSQGAPGRAVSITGCYWDAERSGMTASAGGAGKSAAEMRLKGTYAGWDFDGVWEIDGGYPRLTGVATDSTAEFFFEQRRESRQAAAAVSAKPLVRAAGGAVYINAKPGERVRVRLIDMKGKTVAAYDVVGIKKVSMDKAAPSGGYIVEATLRGRRVFAAPMRIIK